MIRRPPRATRVRSSAASDVYKRQLKTGKDELRQLLVKSHIFSSPRHTSAVVPVSRHDGREPSLRFSRNYLLSQLPGTVLDLIHHEIIYRHTVVIIRRIRERSSDAHETGCSFDFIAKLLWSEVCIQ